MLTILCAFAAGGVFGLIVGGAAVYALIWCLANGVL
jgi:hypothetical protein